MNHSRNRNYVDDFEIKSQQRLMTNATLGYKTIIFMGQKVLSIDNQIETGLDIAGARQPFEHSYDLKGTLYKLEASFKTPIFLKDLSLGVQFSGQYSNARLPGSRQFYIGSSSSVRGYDGYQLYGPSGYYLRNELSYNHEINDMQTIRPYIAIDYGEVIPFDNEEFPQNYLVGVATGFFYQFHESFDLSVNYSQPIDRPDDYDIMNGRIDFSLNFRL